MHLWICLLVTLISFTLAGSSVAGVLSPGISAGVSWPQSGALDKFWEPGPTVGLESGLIPGRRFDLGLSLRYSHFECSNVDGYGTHGASLIAATTWSLPRIQEIGLEMRTGFGGFWTSDYHERHTADGRYRPPVGKIHGWGPRLGLGVHVVVLENAAGSLSVAVLYDRTWASDGFLDTLALIGVFTPSAEPEPDR
jgi:hypothetical protein